MLQNLNPLGDTSPVRLCAETRELAKRYLGGEFTSRMKPATVKVEITGNTLLDYAAHLENLVKTADLGLEKEERLAGAARYREAPEHMVPGAPDWASVSHVTIDFAHAVDVGLKGLEEDLTRAQKKNSDASTGEYYQASFNCLNAMRLWIKRYQQELKNRQSESPYFPQIQEALSNVPENPPRNFFEAVQSLWLFWEFQRLAGNWSGLGRVDQILGKYLDETPVDEIRELLAHFWIKGTEWIGCYGNCGGDAQFYQNVILSGVDKDGNEVANAVTYAILDVVEELHISDFPIALRLSKKSPDALFRRAAEIQALGGGIVSIYNEDVILPALEKFGYPQDEARSFTNDGCWEVIIPGQTAFSYCPYDALALFQNALFADCDYKNLDELFAAYSRETAAKLDHICQVFKEIFIAPLQPSPLLSLLMPSCILSGKTYTNRGAKYNVLALHAGGLPDVANAFLAIEHNVFRDKKFTLKQLKQWIAADFKDMESLRQELFHSGIYYGNNNAEADDMLLKVVNDFITLVEARKETDGTLHPAGISTFGREVAFAPNRMATPFGTHAHEYLASNLAPTPGTDRNGPSAVIQSFCKVDFTRLPNGCPLDLRFDNRTLQSPQGIDMLCSLLKSFIALGGDYLQIDSVSPEMLQDAQRNPDRYPNLAVRISGWSARFTTLTRDWQDMIINRTTQNG